MRQFSLIKIKNIERETTIFGAKVAPFRTFAIIAAIAFLTFIFKMTVSGFFIRLVVLVPTWFLINYIYDKKIISSFNDEQLPDEIINDLD